jgi:ketosteroid isomerase-like protein
VPFRFDNKKQVVNYMKEGLGRLASNSYSFRQLSCRVFNDTTGIANAHDSWTSVTKDGKVQTLHGRATLVFVKRGNHWKIVSSHFSPLPHA